MTWTEAACRDMNPGIFQADEPAYDKDRALAACRRCPVAAECLTQTMKFETSEARRVGIAGGMTPPQRALLSGDKNGARLMAAAEQKELLRLLYDAGRTDKEIHEETWITVKSIGAWRRRLGLLPNGEEGGRTPGQCTSCGGPCDSQAQQCMGCWRKSSAKKEPLPTNPTANNSTWQNDVDPKSVERLIAGDIPHRTTRAERTQAVHHLTDKGLDIPEIADRLRLATRTVERLRARLETV